MNQPAKVAKATNQISHFNATTDMVSLLFHRPSFFILFFIYAMSIQNNANWMHMCSSNLSCLKIDMMVNQVTVDENRIENIYIQNSYNTFERTSKWGKKRPLCVTVSIIVYSIIGWVCIWIILEIENKSHSFSLLHFLFYMNKNNKKSEFMTPHRLVIWCDHATVCMCMCICGWS